MSAQSFILRRTVAHSSLLIPAPSPSFFHHRSMVPSIQVVAVRRMPSASAKLEKQVSLETMEPLKQVLIFIEHKKRNLEKRKVTKSDQFVKLIERKSLLTKSLPVVAMLHFFQIAMCSPANLSKELSCCNSDQCFLNTPRLQNRPGGCSSFYSLRTSCGNPKAALGCRLVKGAQSKAMASRARNVTTTLLCVRL